VFPPLRHLLQLVVTKSPKSRTAGFFGSHGWAGGAGREVQEILEPLEWQFAEPVGFAGKPTQADLDQGRALGRAIADSVQRQ
jgi:flavorubredoxin